MSPLRSGAPQPDPPIATVKPVHVETYWAIRKAIQPNVGSVNVTPTQLARMHSHPNDLLATVAALLTIARGIAPTGRHKEIAAGWRSARKRPRRHAGSNNRRCGTGGSRSLPFHRSKRRTIFGVSYARIRQVHHRRTRRGRRPFQVATLNVGAILLVFVMATERANREIRLALDLPPSVIARDAPPPRSQWRTPTAYRTARSWRH